MKTIECQVVKNFSTYSVGQVLSLTPGVADILQQRKLVKPALEDKKPRGRPRKKAK